MRVPRIVVEIPGPLEGLIPLPPEESHHLIRVLRRRVGDPVTLLTAGAGAFAAEIVAVEEPQEPIPGARAGELGAGGLRVGRVRATVRVLGARRAERGPPTGGDALVAEGGPFAEGDLGSEGRLLLPWTVAVAPVKGEGLDAAIRTAAELGLGRLVPVLTERTVVRAEPGSGRIERWRRIAREAAKQCGREVPLQIPDPIPLPRFLATWREGLEREGLEREGLGSIPVGILLLPGAPFPGGLEGLFGKGAGSPAISPAVFLVGPEGGFSAAEEARARKAGLEPAGFPLPILRTPTAVELVAALGVMLTGVALAAGSGDRPPPGPPAGGSPRKDVDAGASGG